MPLGTAIIGFIGSECLTKGFLAGIVGNLTASVLYDVGKGYTAELAALVVGGLQEGKLPANHDLYKLAHRALRAALLFTHASVTRDIGDKQPFLPAMMQAWKENRLFDQPLVQIRNTPQHDWLRHLAAAIKDEACFSAFDGVGSKLNELNASNLAAQQIDAVMERAVNKRLSDWVEHYVETPHKLIRLTAFEEGVHTGFAVDGDPKQRLTVYAAWCLFFREGLKDDRDERPFKAYVIGKLDELSRQGAAPLPDGDAFAEIVSDKLIEKVAGKIPDISYFDAEFDRIERAIESGVDRTIEHMDAVGASIIDAVKQNKAASIGQPVLPPLQNQFVGRDGEQKQLLAALRSTTGEKVAGIAGLRGQGGIGKTALALAVGHTLAESGAFPDGQVYIDLRGTTDPLSPRMAMESILRQFDPQAAFKDATDEQLAAYYRSFLGPRKVFLLLDNAADARQVKPLLPGGSCGVLVTSRKQFKIGSVDPLPLDLLSPSDAVALARSTAPRLTEAETIHLAEACGRLALAIRIAATQIHNDEGIAVAVHIADLTSDRLAYLDAVEHDEPDGLPFARRAIELSLERLPLELRTFWARLCVFPIDFESVFGSLVALERDDFDIRQGQKKLEELRRHALLELDATTQRYSLHDLSREYAWKRALPDDAARFNLGKRHATVFKDLLSFADRTYLKGKSVEGLALLDSEMASVLAGHAWATTHWETDNDACQLAAAYYDAGVYVLSLRLENQVQIAWLEAAVQCCCKLGDHRGEGNTLGNLGLAVARLGDSRKAIEYHQRNLTIAREIGDRRSEGSALGNLGNAHAALGDARKAIEHFEQMLIVAREIGDRRGEGNVLGNLGNAHAALGNASKAVEYHEQALVVSREIGDHRGEGQDLGNLGNAHAALGDARKAIEHHEQALVISRKIGDRRSEGQDLGNLGNAYAALDETSKAITYHEQALIICREVGDRRSEGAVLGNLGIAYSDLGDTRKAIEYYELRLVIACEIGDRRGEGSALFNRATEYVKQERWYLAAKDMERAAEIFIAIESPAAVRAATLAAEYRQHCNGAAE